MIKQLLFDQLTPVAIYTEIKELFKDDITMLFESVVNSSEGNFSFITIGAQERITYKENQTCYQDTTGEVKKLDTDPFNFLQTYYKNLDQQKYQKLASEVGFAFTDGFIGFIGYDMVKVFEPTLKRSMDGLIDPLETPDLDLVRPSIILAFSHKNAQLTIIQNDEKYTNQTNTIEKLLNKSFAPHQLKSASLDGEGSFSIDEERFKALVDESKEMIRSGDIFQILLSNRYTQKGQVDPLSFYRLLRSKNPSPYLFYLIMKIFLFVVPHPK